MSRGTRPQVRKVTAGPKVARPSARVLKQIHALAPSSLGKIAAVEPESGQFYLADTLLEATDEARKHHPDKAFYMVRIGYRTAHWHRGGLRLRNR